MTHLKAFDKMNEENLKKAVEAFLSPKKNKKFEENCQGIWNIPFNCLRQSQRSKAQSRGQWKPSGAFQTPRTIAERLIDIFGLKEDFPKPNGDEKTRWKFEEQFGPKSHPQTVIQQLASMVYEMVQVPKIE